MRARSSTEVPFEDTVTAWPLRIFRACASARDHAADLHATVEVTPNA